MKIGITSDKYDQDRALDVRPLEAPVRILNVPGVANVAIWGMRKEMLNVEVDPVRLAKWRDARASHEGDL